MTNNDFSQGSIRATKVEKSPTRRGHGRPLILISPGNDRKWDPGVRAPGPFGSMTTVPELVRAARERPASLVGQSFFGIGARGRGSFKITIASAKFCDWVMGGRLLSSTGVRQRPVGQGLCFLSGVNHGWWGKWLFIEALGEARIAIHPNISIFSTYLWRGRWGRLERSALY